MCFSLVPWPYLLDAMPATKLKIVQMFGARKHAMRLVRSSNARSSAASADCVDASRGGTVLSAVASRDSDSLSVPGAASTPSVSEIAAPSSCFEPAPSSVSGSSTIHLRTRFLTKEEIDANAKRRDAVRAGLGSMPATQRKIEQMEPALAPAVATTCEGEHFSLVQIDVFSSLLGCTVCKHCLKGGLTVRESTKLGLATKPEVLCPSCDIIESS